jgi:hypothetical protein
MDKETGSQGHGGVETYISMEAWRHGHMDVETLT